MGLELGANDYIVKPFFVRELIARIKIQFRGQASATRVLKAASLELDRSSCEVRLDGTLLTLTATEFRLLEFLHEPAGCSVQSGKNYWTRFGGMTERLRTGRWMSTFCGCAEGRGGSRESSADPFGSWFWLQLQQRCAASAGTRKCCYHGCRPIAVSTIPWQPSFSSRLVKYATGLVRWIQVIAKELFMAYKIIRRILAVCLLTCIATIPTLAQDYKSLVGKWSMTSETDGDPVHWTLELKESDGHLVGFLGDRGSGTAREGLYVHRRRDQVHCALSRRGIRSS